MRAALALIATFAAAVAVADTRVLIVAKPQPKDATPIPIGDIFAQQLDDDALVQPIVWSISDPIFREAATSGVIGDFSKNPGAKEIDDVARKLRADYVAHVEVSVKGERVTGKIFVTRGGKQVFKSEDNFAIGRSGRFDPHESAKSVARTWASKLAFSLFKGFSKRPKPIEVEPSPGQVPTVAAPVEPPVDNQALTIEIDRVRKAATSMIDRLKRDAADPNRYPAIPAETVAKQIAQIERGRDESIVAIYRDAVDAEPLNVERRRLLIAALRTVGPRFAAIEARRAGELLPEIVDFRVDAAREWLRVPDEAEAQSDLNEAIARDPDAVSIRLLLCELSLNRLEPDVALEHADRAVKRESTAATRFSRALCRALLGGLDGVKADVAAMGVAATPEQRALAMKTLDKSLDDSISTMKGLIQRATVKKTDDAVKDGVDQLSRTLASRLELLQAITPATERALYDRLALAYKLLSQSVIDLRGYTAGEEDGLEECRLNLAEAVRRLNASRTPVGK